MTHYSKTLSAVTFGKNASCPFCLAIRDFGEIPAIGSKFRFLSHPNFGETGVIAKASAHNLTEVLATLDNHDQNTLTSIHPWDLIEIFPAKPIPSWLPQVKVSLLSGLHEHILNFCDALKSKHTPIVDSINPVIYYIWSNRIFIDPEELFELAYAHGANKRHKSKICNLFSSGMSLLVFSFGKKPFKNTRKDL